MSYRHVWGIRLEEEEVEEIRSDHSAQGESASLMEQLHRRSDLHLARKVFHASTGLMMILIYAFLLDRSAAVLVLGILLGIASSLEYLRMQHPAVNQKILSLFSGIMRKSEASGASGVTFYLAAALIVVAIFPKPIALLSIAYLAFGDPLASVFGILYGDRSIRFSNGKSLIGTTAGVLTCFVLTFIFFMPLEFSWGQLWVLAIAGGLAGGTAENLPLDIDDNFSIPVVSGFVLWLFFVIFNV